MPNAADDFQDEAIAHQILVLRAANQLRDEFNTTLAEAEAAMLAVMAQHVERIGDVGPGTFVDKTREIERAIGATLAIREAPFKQATDQLFKSLISLGVDEAAGTLETIEDLLPVRIDLNGVPVEHVIAAVRKRPMQGRLLKDWAKNLQDGERIRVTALIRQGVMEGRTVDELVRALRGTRRAGYADGILQIGRRDAEAVIRTAVQHVTNSARQDAFEANSDVISGVKWVSTLDGRTTPICRDRDGKVSMFNGLPLPKGFLQLQPPNARPPAHFGCRSVIVAIFDPDGIADKIGERPFVRTSKTRRMREKDFRRETRDQLGEDQWREMSGPERTAAISDRRRAWTRENVGQVASETTYGEWLKRQPAAFQDDVLGPARARMFRAGEETVHSFVDSRGKLLTIKQLKERRQSRKKG